MNEIEDPNSSTPAIQSLLALTHDIVSGNELSEILDRIPAMIRLAIPCEASALSLFDPETETLYVYETDGALIEGKLPQNIKLGEGWLGRVVESKQARIINDAKKQDTDTFLFKPKSGNPPHSMMAEPIIFEDTLYGAIMLVNKSKGDFDSQDLDVMHLFTGMIGTALFKLDQAEKEREQKRLVQIGSALATILHDVKNPLTVVRGFAELLKRKNKDNEKYAQEIIANIDNLVAMLQDCLDYSKGHSIIRRETINANEFLESFADSLQPLLEMNNVTLLKSFESNKNVSVDIIKLSRALYNLATNSIKFMTNNDKTLCIRSRIVGRGWLLEIADTGIGISKQNQANLFTPYFSTDQVQGTGLGLVSVKSVVDAHGGAISLHSEEDLGTTFLLTLPVSESDIDTDILRKSLKVPQE